MQEVPVTDKRIDLSSHPLVAGRIEAGVIVDMVYYMTIHSMGKRAVRRRAWASAW